MFLHSSNLARFVFMWLCTINKQKKTRINIASFYIYDVIFITSIELLDQSASIIYSFLKFGSRFMEMQSQKQTRREISFD